MEKVLYEELCPEEFKERLKECPIAYLPLGTLEWHGPHLPLGADGIQPLGLFVRVAEKIGGIVLPTLFLGPDRFYHDKDHGLAVILRQPLRRKPFISAFPACPVFFAHFFQKALQAVL